MLNTSTLVCISATNVLLKFIPQLIKQNYNSLIHPLQYLPTHTKVITIYIT